MSYENHRHPAQRETGQRGGRKTQGSPGTPPFRPLAQPLAGLHCRVPGVVAYPSGVALLLGDVTKYIPDYARVEFRLTKHDSITVRLREDGKSVEVHTSRGAILVRPQAANVVRVVPEDLSERF